jgi:hypothetical protein
LKLLLYFRADKQVALQPGILAVAVISEIKSLLSLAAEIPIIAAFISQIVNKACSQLVL